MVISCVRSSLTGKAAGDVCSFMEQLKKVVTIKEKDATRHRHWNCVRLLKCKEIGNLEDPASKPIMLPTPVMQLA